MGIPAAAKDVTMVVQKSCFIDVHREEIERSNGLELGDLVDAATRYTAPFRSFKFPYRYRFIVDPEVTVDGGEE